MRKPLNSYLSVQVDVSNPLGDDRFAAIFTNPDFEVDESSEVGSDDLFSIVFSAANLGAVLSDEFHF